jgi:NAD(P)H-dependent FMN reductase
MCKGCFACLERGEEKCPLKKDDAHAVYEKLMEADGVIVATPVYSLQVTAYLKNLLDRLAFIFHRPSMFHKTFLGIVTQGVYGDKKTLKYLNEVAKFWGFKVTTGLTFTTPPSSLTKKDFETIKAKTVLYTNKFYQKMMQPQMPKPGLLDLIIFRLNRSSKPYIKEYNPRDFDYFQEKGWLKAPYYYQTKLNPMLVLVGAIMDKLGKKMGKGVREKYRMVKEEQ